MCIYITIFFIHSSFNGYLGCFHVLGIVNSPAMNSGVHVSFGTMVFFWFTPRIGIAGSYCSSILEIWVDLENVIECHTEREKQISNTKAYMWNLEKWYRLTYL